MAGLEGGPNLAPQVRFQGRGAGFIDVGQDANSGFVVEISDAPALTVTTAGQVGIGTTAPGAQLQLGTGVQIDTSLLGAGFGGLMTFTPGGVRNAYVGPIGGGGYVLGLHENTGVFIDGAVLHDPATDVTSVFADVKNFRTANPDDEETDIVYACIEGPEAAMYVRGTAWLTAGQARIELPRHFEVMAAEQGFTVSLTPLSPQSRGLCVVYKRPGSIGVAELMNGTGSYEFDWEVKAVRKGFENYEVIREKVRSPEAIEHAAVEPAASELGDGRE